MDHDLLAQIRELLAEDAADALRRELQQARAADLADAVKRLEPEERAYVFTLLDDDAAGAVLHELDEAVAATVISDLPAARASRILGDMPHDDAADVLQDLSDETADALLAGMGAAEADDVRELLEYPENTAGGRMITEFVTAPEEAKVDEVIANLRAHPPAVETAYYLYVCNARGQLAGVVSLRNLIVASPEATIGEIMTREVIRVSASADQEEAADLVARYDLLALPVVDDNDRVVGVITVDDVLEVLEEEATEDILRLSSGGTPHPEHVLPSPWSRLPGAAGAVLTGLAIAVFLAAFREGFRIAAPFLLFIPLALAVSEVVTGQVMAAVAGFLRHDHEEPHHRLPQAILREFLVIAGIAALAGILLASLLGHWQRLGHLGITLGIAVFLVAVVASVVGAIAPVLSRFFSRDPSAVSISFTAMIADMASLVAYLWIVAIRY